ncbi:MAG: HEPN domain-containing protein [Fretibacterium sp.]|nr:HEPN domain-containing protein [Fretibacterium sp.]
MPELELADEWRRFARMDFDSALYLQGFHPLPIEIICFHCQQAAEKALKAVLAYHDEEIPYIHDTSKLWGLALALEPALPDLKAQADHLKKYATAARYPHEVNVGEADMQRSLADARAILEAVEALWRAP